MEQMFSTIQGVNVPVMIVNGVELPTQAIEVYNKPDGTPAEIKVYDATFDGDKTYVFKIDDPANGIVGQEVTFAFNPLATTY